MLHNIINGIKQFIHGLTEGLALTAEEEWRAEARVVAVAEHARPAVLTGRAGARGCFLDIHVQ